MTHSVDTPVSPATLRQMIQETLSTLLAVPAEWIPWQSAFTDLGMGSAQGVAFIEQLGLRTGWALSPTLLYDHPSPQALLDALCQRTPTLVPADTRHTEPPPADILLLGADCRLPGAGSVEDFWQLLCDAGVSVGAVPETHPLRVLCRAQGIDAHDPLLLAGTLPDPAGFDAAFFGIADAEARLMDPQQRWLLESTWHAIRDAGIDPLSLQHSRTGVFIGASAQDFQRHVLRTGRHCDIHAGTGTAMSVIAGRIAYQFDFRGPAWTVDTACSSSLVALHQACQSLRTGDCDHALVAGVNLLLDPQYGLALQRGGMLSPSGRCHSFDRAADGYVRSEGQVTLFLSRAAPPGAQPPIAVIRATAVNQDGRSNGLTAPNGDSQQHLVRQALATASLADDAIQVFECHGTGTALGDPIEVNALARVFPRRDDTQPPCLIGSVKANVGHLESAAGLAGALRLALSLHHRRWTTQPPMSGINPHLALDGSRLVIATQSATLPAHCQGGVNSFGFSGTNAHAVLAAAPAPAKANDDLPDWPWLCLSAHSRESLRTQIAAWREALPTLCAQHPLPTWLAAATRRCSALPWRIALHCPDEAQALQALDNAEPVHCDASTFNDTDGDGSPERFLQGGPPPRIDARLPRLWGLPRYAFMHRRHWPDDITADPVMAAPKSTMVTDPDERVRLGSGIWWDSLAIDPEQRRDDASFISLGGTSLLASRIASELRRRLGVGVAMSDILVAGSLNGLHQWLRTAPVRAADDDTLMPSIGTEAQDAPFPLTDMQMAYWLGRDKAVPGAMPIQVLIELRNAHLDIPRLRHAWRALTTRHPMLRAIVTGDGRQRILPDAIATDIDTERLTETGDALDARLTSERERLWRSRRDLTQWPQHTLRVWDTEEGQVLHCLFDGWSIDGASYQILFRELADLYQHPEHPLPALDWTFADYLRALARHTSRQDMSRCEAYWEAQLPTLPPAPALPLATQVEALGECVMQRRRFTLSANEWAAFREQARQHQLTPACALLATYAQVLSRWSRHSDITLNVPRFNRQPLHPDVERIIGEFASFTLLPCERRAEDAFTDYAQRLQQRLWQHLDHDLISGVSLLRQLGNGALMPYVFTTLPDQPDSSLHDQLRRIGHVTEMRTQTPQVWIDCQYWPDLNGIELSWDVLEEMFPEGLIDSMFDAFRQRVLALCEYPAQWRATATLPLPAAQHACRRRINDTAAPLPATDLFRLVAERAAIAGDAPAILSTDGVAYSYRELIRQVENVAAQLQESDGPVALCMDKTPLAVISLLAVLRQGRAYVPIDPGQPQSRRDAIVRDSGARLLLADDAGEALPWRNDATRLRPNPIRTQQPPPPANVSASDHAYLLYTSGSTGTPKGVIITQGGICNRILDLCQRFALSGDDRVIGISALHHDMSVFDLFVTLASGAALVMPAHAKRREPAHWLALMHEHRVSVWNSVPAFMQMLLDHDGAIPASLRLVLLGGDWVSTELVGRLRRRAAEAQLVSVGGPTEVGLMDIAHVIDETNLAPGQRIPYGQPLSNARQYLLNALGEECPEWVVGEICHAGAGVSPGYHGQPALDAEKFIVHPPLPEDETRLLRSGDLGYRRPDGAIQFVGRRDFQVKLHGQRIELGDIETHCRALPGVRDALALTFDDAPHTRIGVVLKPDPASASPAWDSASLRSALAPRLPDYMLPARCIVLPQWPITANGKIDRQAMAAQLAAATPPAPAGSAPMTGLIQQIAAIWQKLLQVEGIAPDTNFFHLGGNSVTAVALSRELAALTGQQRPIAAIFEHPTLRQLADSYHRPDDDEPLRQAQARGRQRRQRRHARPIE
ncbi:amino acid adenylation domain-containing protein [Lysobacter pythonis]|uniref:Amino acid adenylation domain-containing protein n=1 Tax=Solilutibacter pythonis TaxID=2483112 RepID=A0A3M2I540_9GAMM|nr:non-ribosomal peptide synthetase [Lysobacter pythonis]RMH93587.1 amino acid adenylation domain-containing protein [Lysobacter pythonis]